MPGVRVATPQPKNCLIPSRHPSFRSVRGSADAVSDSLRRKPAGTRVRQKFFELSRFFQRRSLSGGRQPVVAPSLIVMIGIGTLLQFLD